MTVQERQQRAKLKKRRQAAKCRMILMLVAIFVITIGSVAFGSVFSSAKNSATDLPQHKYYKSITIEKGDSLWSIAEEYCADTCESTREYVDELKQLNQLSSDTIHTGQHLIVAYYDAEVR